MCGACLSAIPDGSFRAYSWHSAHRLLLALLGINEWGGRDQGNLCPTWSTISGPKGNFLYILGTHQSCALGIFLFLRSEIPPGRLVEHKKAFLIRGLQICLASFSENKSLGSPMEITF